MAIIASSISEQKIHDNYFDNARFILITMVVLGHFIEPFISYNRLVNAIFITIYTFHIPVFVLVAGYFSKSFKSPKNLILKYAAPFLLFQLLYQLANHYVFNFDLSLARLILLPEWMMWFLISLLLWRLYLPFIVKLKHPIIFSILLSVIAGYFNSVGVIMSLSRTITFLPFFLAGYFLEKKQIIQVPSYRMKFYSVIYFLTLAVVVFYLDPQKPVHGLLFGFSSYVKMGFHEWYAGVYRLILLVFQVASSVFFLILVPKGYKFYTALGANTMSPYLLHGFVILIFYHFNLWTEINTNFKIVFLLFFAIVCAFILSLKPVYIISGLTSFRHKNGSRAG